MEITIVYWGLCRDYIGVYIVEYQRRSLVEVLCVGDVGDNCVF